MRFRLGDAHLAGWRLHEEASVAAHLHPQERCVQHKGQRRDANRLGDAELARAGGVVGEYQGDRGEQHDHRNVRVGTLDIERLLAIAHRAGDQADTDDQVHDDHHHGKYRVSANGREITWPQQDRGDKNHFDRHNRQRQNQCAVGFAKLLRQVVGFVHHTERRHQDGKEQQQKHPGRGQ
ncbi:hypothetical protein D3C80_723890 [compost metagenome]